MKILITGAAGQLGWELQRSAPAEYLIDAVDVDKLDITHGATVNDYVKQQRPDVIINAAAYTAVDKAESDETTAFAVNRDGVANLAMAAKEHHARLIHISTDFIFDGSRCAPYLPDAPANPIGVYGASKWAGEQALAEVLNDEAVIIRTAWVYSSHGANFVKTMLRLMGEREQLGVIADQVGTPTWANGLAYAIWQFVQKPELTGTYHWTDAGIASWYDFAVAIQEEAIQLGLLNRAIAIRPISTADYPTPAKRPAYSVMDKNAIWSALSVEPRHWRQNLRIMLAEL